jgi:Zn ribbon nucleic-acid-binding protein
MGKALRACPICPSCGSRKFKMIENSEKQVIVECVSCAKRLSI